MATWTGAGVRRRPTGQRIAFPSEPDLTARPAGMRLVAR